MGFTPSREAAVRSVTDEPVEGGLHKGSQL